MSRAFSHVVLIAVEGLGAGSAQINGTARGGNATIAHVADYVGGLSLPTLGWLGLGNAAPARGLAPAEPPAASWGVVAPSVGAGPASSWSAPLVDAVRGAGLDAIEAGTTLGPSARPAALLAEVTELLDASPTGLIVASFDPAGGHGASPVTMARRLMALDAALGDWIDAVGQEREVLVLVASPTGLDPVLHNGAAPLGEATALLAYSPLVPSGVSLGHIGGLGDVLATAADALGAHVSAGDSFLGAVLA